MFHLILMILTLGLILNLYLISFLVPSAPILYKRITQSLILLTIFLNSDLLFVLPHESLILLDGQIAITETIEKTLNIILIFSIIILQFYIHKNSEHYFLICLNLLGLIYLIYSIDWIITILSWELFNLSLYLFIGLNSNNQLGSSIKYFLLSVFTTAFLLLSIAYIYSLTGSTCYENNLIWYSVNEEINYINIILFLVLAFKLGLAPLHSWAPDLYDGLKVEYASWLMTIPKLGFILFLIHIKSFIDLNTSVILAIISLIIGSIGLSSQYLFRRFLAYSSISNMGFIFIGYSTNEEVAIIYSIIYILSIIILFLITDSINHISDISSIYSTNRPLYYVLFLLIFSMAGFPPLAGFYTKLLVIYSLIASSYNNIIIIFIIISSLISACNYITLIIPNKSINYNIIAIPSYNRAILITNLIVIIIIAPIYM